MYTKSRGFLLRSSASAVAHNLDICRLGDEWKGAVIHKSIVNLITWNATTDKQNAIQVQCKGTSGEKQHVLRAKWCTFNKEDVLMIILQDGLQIYDASGTELSLWYHFEKGCHGKCIASLGNGHVALGNNDGTVAILQLEPRSRDVHLSTTLQTGWKGAVTCVTAASHYLACGDNYGEIIVWEPIVPYTKLQTFETYGFPCTSICIWQQQLIAAYGSGHIRLFGIKPGQIFAEITAHAKWIPALDIAKSSGIVISVSEDSFARVWQLSDNADCPISLLHSECILDTLLCGACFLDDDGKEFAVTGFESEEIICFSKSHNAET